MRPGRVGGADCNSIFSACMQNNSDIATPGRLLPVKDLTLYSKCFTTTVVTFLITIITCTNYEKDCEFRDCFEQGNFLSKSRKSTFSVLFQNIRSYSKNFDKFEVVLESLKLKFSCISNQKIIYSVKYIHTELCQTVS